MPSKQDRVNDFVIKLANVNGTGSASANTLLMKAIFRMGIPVVGKNFFPSNIQGSPTWYEIRVTRDGYRARGSGVDFMVAMNAQTYGDDLDELRPGGFLLYDATWPRDTLYARDDVTVFGIPLSQMANESFATARARILMKNVMYVGAVAALLDVDMDVIRELLGESFVDKPHLAEANMTAIQAGFDYARAQFDCTLPLGLEPMDATAGHIMIDGNTTAALGCVYAGATVGSWYPITPSTSLFDAFTSFCDKLRKDPETGANNYCILQAEDELSAIGMVLGASWNGARAFTSTSGPGLSLMTEFLGYAYYAEIPAVVFDIQRVGPSTGLPTRTQQADILAAAYASHGDTKHVVLFPADPVECFHLTVQAFDLADRLQTPVLVLSDLDIGMNDWMCPALEWDESYRPDRGKILDAAALQRGEPFYRYADVDGDGVARVTRPGVHPDGSFFIRGSGHDRYGAYTEDPDRYRDVMDRLLLKWDTAAHLVPEPVEHGGHDTDLAIVSLGSCDAAIREALDRLADKGISLNYLRLRAFPFAPAVEKFLNDHRHVFVVEQNRDAQLCTLLQSETGVSADKLYSVLHYDGLPMAADAVFDAVSGQLRPGVAA